jgi:DNA-binding transcriptional ArsR family regulator
MRNTHGSASMQLRNQAAGQHLSSIPVSSLWRVDGILPVNQEVFAMQAEFYRVLANPKRLMILALLAKKEMSVGEIVTALDSKLANISQHLRVLRNQNIVSRRKEGQAVFYRLGDQRLMDACHLIQKTLFGDMKRRGKIAAGLAPEDMVGV